MLFAVLVSCAVQNYWVVINIVDVIAHIFNYLEV